MDHHCRKSISNHFQIILTKLVLLNNSCKTKYDCLILAWLNNCIGHYNHRYFFMYMLYTVSGSIFLILFGLPLAYDVLWTGQDESWTETEPLEGHAIKINETGHIIPILQVSLSGVSVDHSPLREKHGSTHSKNTMDDSKQ